MSPHEGISGSVCLLMRGLNGGGRLSGDDAAWRMVFFVAIVWDGLWGCCLGGGCLFEDDAAA